jgi:hypothetical protein
MSGSPLSPEDNPAGLGKDTPSLAARRARLRGTLTRRGISEVPATAEVQEQTVPNPSESTDSTPKASSAETPPPAPSLPGSSQVTMRTRPSFGISMGADISRSSAAEMLKNIDQAMATCASNLANLQKVASEQAAALKTLTQTLQDKSLHDAGIDLNTLTESFSSALEPMKEMGRLVPAIDQLNTAVNEHIHREDKISPDDLVANLAQQLADGAIDPQTFKSAYKAIFPERSAADLLRGLVELLGTQRLSGTLFRAAYDSVQISELSADSTGQAVNEPETLPAFEQLAKANTELQETLAKREKEMEQEYDALLKNKDKEITQRESEVNTLRQQMEELRSQTQELVSDLHRQAIAEPVEIVQSAPPPETKPAPKINEPAPQPKSEPVSVVKEPVSQLKNTLKPEPASGFFDTAARPPSFYADNSIAIAAAQGNSQPTTIDAAKPVSTSVPAAAPATPVASGVSMASPSVPAARPIAGAGRHGTGVRAQVFEVIVRQALAGAPWREMCAGPMQVNNITAEEVEAEVSRRQGNPS